MKIVFLDGFTINPGDLNWAPLQEIGDFTVYDRTADSDIINRSKEADVLIVNKTRLTAEHFAQLPNLKLVCEAATGFDNIDVKAARQHNVSVCNCANYSTQIVAQMVTSFLLEVADSVGSYTIRNHEGEWSRSKDFCYTIKARYELTDKKIAIVGLGNIGSAVARIMLALGLRVFAVTSKEADQLPSGISKISVEEAFKTCDIVSLNCPLTATNKGFVNSALLAVSNPDLILINTARGGLVIEQDVADALLKGQLGAYCTDVLSQEPARPDCPLLYAPRTFITPHIAWNTLESRQRILSILVNNISSFFKGAPEHVVN